MNMKSIFGIPKELKEDESRVALTPDSIKILTDAGHEVYVEKNAGLLSGFDDSMFVESGAKILDTKEEIWNKANVIVKVKEPQKEEYPLFKEDQVIFSYMHLAVEKELAALQDRFASLKDVEDRKTINTDIVNIDFDGYVDGEEIKGGSAKGYMLDLAHSNFIDGFAQQLVDHGKGEEFKINVKFPENYHDDKLKGKDAEFNIKINGIKEKVLPEINDDLAKRVNPKFNTLDELKEDIRKYSENTVKAENERRTAEKIYDTLFEKIDIKIQDTMINREIQALMGEFKQRVNMQGGNFDEMLEKEGHQKVYDQLKEEAVKRIKTSLIIGKIAQEEKINVTAEDIQGKIGDLAHIYRTTSENIVEEIRKNPNLLNSLNQQVISEKVTKLMVDSAKVSYKK